MKCSIFCTCAFLEYLYAPNPPPLPLPPNPAGAVPDYHRLSGHGGLRGRFHGRVELLRTEVGRPVLASVAVLGRHSRGGAVHSCVPWLHQCHQYRAQPAVGKKVLPSPPLPSYSIKYLGETQR